MSSISDKLRTDAAEQRQAASVLVNAADLLTDGRKLVAAIVGLTTANVFDALADSVDVFLRVEKTDEHSLRMKAFRDKNNTIRRAAAKAVGTGDWSEFFRIIDGDSGGTENTGPTPPV